MAVKKKPVVNEAATDAKTTTDAKTRISVDAHKLSQGLKMTFEGVAMVFDSLGAEFGMQMMGVDMNTPVVAPSAATSSAADKKQEEKKTGADVEDTKTKTEPVAAEAEATEETAAETVAATDATVEENKNAETPADSSAAEQAVPASTVTLDDITKIIVQKIKKNRSNNEKIGSILKTYGAAKVGELPASKYEAFLTDLAAI